MDLAHEKFEGMKELSEIQVAISKGRAFLTSLEERKEEYLNEREMEAVKRVEKALVDSEDLLKAIGENHGELVGYRTQLEDLNERVRSLVQSVEDCIGFLSDATTRLEERLAVYDRKVAEFNNEVRRARALIEGQKEGLSVRSDNLTKEEIKVADLRKTLERAVERLKDKKK